MTQNYHILKQFPSKKEEEDLNFPLFAKQDYWKSNSGFPIVQPITFRNSAGQIIAFWCFAKDKVNWKSPISAPFYLPFLHQSADIAEILVSTIAVLKSLHNQGVQIMLPPLLATTIILKLVPSNFRIHTIAIGFHLKVDQTSFERKIASARKQQKLRALQRDNYNVTEITLDQWTDTYKQNISWRMEKKHKNYISLEKFSALKQNFHEHYIGFQIKEANRLIGTAFIVKVSNQVIYVYSLITDPQFDENEAALLLWEKVYSYAKKGGFKFIDMGTSMMPGTAKINKNLASYKASIGGELYRKYSLIC